MRWLSMTPTEHQEQKAVIEWAEAMKFELPGVDLLYANTNGGMRPKTVKVDKKGRISRFSTVGQKLREEGQKAGVPDLFLPIARQEWHGLYVELKTKTGAVSIEQRIWIRRLTAQGYAVTVCRGSDEASDTIRRYLIDPSWAPSQSLLENNGIPAQTNP